MRHRKHSGTVDPSQHPQRRATRSDVVAMPEVGDHFIGPSGRIWTVQTVARRANRIVLTRPAEGGLAAAVVDLDALGTMVPLGRTTTFAPAIGRTTTFAPAIGRSAATSPSRLSAPKLHHVSRDGQSHRGFHGRRRMLIHLGYDEAHHAHVETYESLHA